MAGDWIKMRVNLDTDPSVIMMAAAFDTDELCIVGRLWKVWSWADQHTADGNAVRVTTSFLDRLTNCPGFAKAMRDAGWLTGRDGALTFPSFDRHNGQPAKTRALTKDRVKEHRNGSSVTPALPEKRRVEKSKSPPAPQGGFVGGEEVVEAIYQLYPRKVAARQKALHAVRLALTKIDAGTLRAAVVKYAKTPGLDREDGRFIPSPVTWFAEDGWKDYLPKAVVKVAPPPMPSRALGDVRLMFSRKLIMSPEEQALTRKFIEGLTPEDDKFITPEERIRIDNLKVITA